MARGDGRGLYRMIQGYGPTAQLVVARTSSEEDVQLAARRHHARYGEPWA